MARYYESDVTRMIKKLLENKPEIVSEQKKGRAFWWDKPADQDTQNRAAASRVRQQAYVYQSKV